MSLLTDRNAYPPKNYYISCGNSTTNEATPPLTCGYVAVAVLASLLAGCAAPSDPPPVPVAAPVLSDRPNHPSRYLLRPPITPPVVRATPSPKRGGPPPTQRSRQAGFNPGGHWWSPTLWTLAMQHCIGSHESVSYTGVGPGHHYGRYQFSDATWTWASKLGGHASDWPPAVQDRAFLRLFDNGVGRHQWSTYAGCRATLGGPA